MQQVLFTVPIFEGTFPPDGIPVYGFGAMLFVTFVTVVLWGSYRAKKIGMEPTKFQDFAIWVFVSGLIGARVLYMIQYANQFPQNSIGDILGSFFRIWEGGIVFYGSALGGAIGYGLFYWFVMRRFKVHVSGWQLADAVAPLLALGLAIGRIGCYLNGCCWGQVANEEACVVPLGAAHFPMLPAHARPQLVGEKLLQTSTGFSLEPRTGEDPRSVVAAVEKDSPADRAGVRKGDRITKVNGESAIAASVSGPPDAVQAVFDKVQEKDNGGGKLITRANGETRVVFDDLPSYFLARAAARTVPDATFVGVERLDEIAREWPRGKALLSLQVERAKSETETEFVNLSFAPKTVGLYPTQLYESLSMILLILVLLAFYPLRRHDGQLMVVLMLGYAAHRFTNESLRIEPSYGGGLTLSQWASVIVVVAAVAMELYLWRTMPSRWKGEPQYVPLPAGETGPSRSDATTAAARPPEPKA